MLRTCIGMLCCACVLCGCSAINQPEQYAQAVQEKYTAAQSIQTTAQIISNLNEDTITYEINYDYTPERAVMTVEAPESIAGIRAVITGTDVQDIQLEYEDTQLETAMPEKKGLTPADVVTYLLDDLMHHTPTQVWQEDSLLALRYEQTDEAGTSFKEVYLTTDGMLQQARIYSEGKQILQCTFSSCTLNGG